MPFGQQIGELGVGQQRLGHGPGGFHRSCQPGTALLASAGDGLQLGFDPGDLGGLAAAFHEQHAAGFDRTVVVEIRCASKRAGSGCGGGLSGGPPFRESDQRPCGALERDGVGERRLGVVLLVLAMVLRQIRRHRQQPVAPAPG